MHILWVSDFPGGKSSYANQTRLLVPRIVENSDHKITILAIDHHHKTTIPDTDITILPALYHPYGYDVTEAYIQHYKPDVVFFFKDGYLFEAGFMKSLSIPAIVTGIYDTEPPLPHLDVLFNMSLGIFSPTRLGVELFAKQGNLAHYTPLVYDDKIFYPVKSAEEKKAIRERFGIPEDAFFMLMVGDNNTSPLSRKLFDVVIFVFSTLCQLPDHENILLGLHTDVSPSRGGLDIVGFLEFLQVPQKRIYAPNPLEYHMGIKHEVVADLMRAADLLINPSMGEGFGLPLIEAQACGTRVITVDWTAMRETTIAGYKIETNKPSNGDLLQINSRAFRFRVNSRALFNVLEGFYQQRADIAMPELRGAEITKERYAVDNAVKEHWIPAFNEIQCWLEGGIF